MNDFLHSLRSNKDKRFDRNRRNYESPGYRPNDRMSNSDRRRKGSYRGQQNEQAQAYAAINKLLPTIKALLESQNEDRQKLIQAEERKAAAMESIASLLKQLSGGAAEALPAMDSIESLCENDECEPVQKDLSLEPEGVVGKHSGEQRTEGEAGAPAVASTSRKTMPREELVAMIKGLREEGLSYEKIARHLQENQVATISGRGIWRGQAVSKLLQ